MVLPHGESDAAASVFGQVQFVLPQLCFGNYRPRDISRKTSHAFLYPHKAPQSRHLSLEFTFESCIETWPEAPH